MNHVYRNLNQTALDEQYNNRARYPDYKQHFASWRQWSATTRARIPSQLDVPFGPTALESLDIFPASTPGAPIYLFIHGGYWYSLDKSDYSYVAEGMRPHGVTTVVNNFGLAPQYRMDQIVAHNKKAIVWLWKNASSFGGDPNRIYVCGHSAGGHLGLMLLATDWPALDAELPADPVKGVCSIAGIFDLEPIRLSFLNETLHLTPDEARRNSPALLHYPNPSHLSLVVAFNESDEFHRQSEQMRQRWETMGLQVEYLVPPDLDHFSVVNDLGNPDCMLVRHQLRNMQAAFASELSA